MRKVLTLVALTCALGLTAPTTASAEAAGVPGLGTLDAPTNQSLIDLADARAVQPDPAARRGARPGSYPRRKGIVLVTPDKYKGLIPTGHAAIIHGRNAVVEALAEGVVRGDNDWGEGDKVSQAYAVDVKSTSATQESRAADWAYSQIGKPYNYNYANKGTRKSFYCSQLVWAAFSDNFGVDLDTFTAFPAIHPMEIVANKDKTTVIWRKK